jgi:predicted RNase H-like HicB family nuclease
MRYTVVLTPEPDGSAVNVTVPAMPGILTWARTSEEALTTAREAIALHLEGFAERGKPFPADRQPRTHAASRARTHENGLPARQRSQRRVVTVEVSLPESSIRR